MAKRDATISKESATALMPAIDEATKAVLEAAGLEAFHFTAAVCPEEGWMRLTIKVRALGCQECGSRDRVVNGICPPCEAARYRKSGGRPIAGSR